MREPGLIGQLQAELLRLDCPAALARRLVQALRESSWCGRHPLAAFCLFPGLASVFANFIALLLTVGVLSVLNAHPPATQMAKYHAIAFFARAALWSAIALTPLIFYWLSRRFALSFKWMAAACLVCSIHSWFCQIVVSPHNLTYCYWYGPANWPGAMIPLLVGLAAYVRQRKLILNFPQSPTT